MGHNSDEELLDYVETIRKSAKQMEQLVFDILSFSRLGYNELLYKSVDINNLVKEIIQGFEPELKNRNIHWSISKLPLVSGDESLLRQVFYIISNSIKFTKNREKTNIEIGNWTTESEHIFFIKDNGAGFDMKYKDKLFEPFKRLHSKEEFEGTGVGLSNVRRIISRHRGRVWAEAEENKGATFYFSLPLESEK